MYIYIPSLSRVGRVSTLSSIPENWLDKARIVVSKNEANLYRDFYGKAFILVAPVFGIAETRQWIIENSLDKHALFIDDDMSFSVRCGEGIKLRSASKADVGSMFLLLESWLNSGYIHAGISQRAGNNHVPDEFEIVTRMNNIYAYDVKAFLNSGVRFDSIKVMEDFHVTLSLLKLGFPNIVSYKYAWGQRGSGAPGGCSVYRTSSVQRDAAYQLLQFHSDCVRLVAKRSKRSWTGIDNNYRVDVVIEWKKAYRPKQRNSFVGKGGISKWL